MRRLLNEVKVWRPRTKLNRKDMVGYAHYLKQRKKSSKAVQQRIASAKQHVSQAVRIS